MAFFCYQLCGRRRGRLGLLRLDSHFFPLEVGQTAFAFNHFVGLRTHKVSLLCYVLAFVWRGNMASCFVRFNSYLVLGAVFLCCFGCKSLKKKEATTLRLHQEVVADTSGRSSPVPVYRQNPIFVNVEKEPFLNEGFVAKASVIDALGSFQIMIQFDRRGTWLLEQYTTAHRGRRIAIFSHFGVERWLGAPLTNKRISDGVLVFTPDATREEAERIVLGLNNVAKETQKGNL